MKKERNKTEYTARQLAFAHFEALLITQVPRRWAKVVIKEANREVGGEEKQWPNRPKMLNKKRVMDGHTDKGTDGPTDGLTDGLIDGPDIAGCIELT